MWKSRRKTWNKLVEYRLRKGFHRFRVTRINLLMLNRSWLTGSLSKVSRANQETFGSQFIECGCAQRGLFELVICSVWGQNCFIFLQGTYSQLRDGILPLSDMWKTFLPFRRLYFHYLEGFLMYKLFEYQRSSFSSFLWLPVVGDSEDFSTLFSFKSFKHLSLTFRYSIYFKFWMKCNLRGGQGCWADKGTCCQALNTSFFSVILINKVVFLLKKGGFTKL